MYISLLFFFFFNDTATTEIYTLSLHDALPILHLLVRTVGAQGHACRPGAAAEPGLQRGGGRAGQVRRLREPGQDRKSTRLNSSHSQISYAVFCLKKKKKSRNTNTYVM